MLEYSGNPLNVTHGGDQDLQGCDVRKLISSWCEVSPYSFVDFVLLTPVNTTVLVVGDAFLPKVQSAMKSEAGEVASRDSRA